MRVLILIIRVIMNGKNIMTLDYRSLMMPFALTKIFASRRVVPSPMRCRNLEFKVGTRFILGTRGLFVCSILGQRSKFTNSTPTCLSRSALDTI